MLVCASTRSPAAFSHFLRHVIDIEIYCSARKNRRDCCCGGVVDGKKNCLKKRDKAGNPPPGLHSISKQGIPDETVDYALVRGFMINASVTLLRFYRFCDADLRCSGASRTHPHLFGTASWGRYSLDLCPF